MKFYLSTILLLVFAFGAFGQTEKSSNTKKLIAWGESPECAEVDSQISKSETLRCDSFVADGESVMSIYFNGIFVAASLTDENGYIIADVYVGNNTDRRILVNPDTSVMVFYKSKAEYKATNKNLEIRDAIPPSAIAGKLINRVRWANALSSVGASMQTTTATITSQNSQTGTTQSTVTVPNRQAQAQAEQQNTSRANSTLNQAADIMASALKPNTIFAKDKINGLVYFKRHKKSTYAQMWLVVDNTYFIFDIAR